MQYPASVLGHQGRALLQAAMATATGSSSGSRVVVVEAGDCVTWCRLVAEVLAGLLLVNVPGCLRELHALIAAGETGTKSIVATIMVAQRRLPNRR